RARDHDRPGAGGLVPPPHRRPGGGRLRPGRPPRPGGPAGRHRRRHCGVGRPPRPAPPRPSGCTGPLPRNGCRPVLKAIRQPASAAPGEPARGAAPAPQPAEAQVRTRGETAGVPLLDTVTRRGEAGPRAMPSLPMTPGREVAGVVDQAGPGTDGALLGRRVVADLGLASGGYAELALARARSPHEIPGSPDAHPAGTMIRTGPTATALPPPPPPP